MKGKMNCKKLAGFIGLAAFALLAGVTVWNLQLDLFSLNDAVAGLALAAAPLVLTEEQVKEFQGILGEIKGGWGELKNLPATFRSLQGENAELKQQVTDVR